MTIMFQTLRLIFKGVADDPSLLLPIAGIVITAVGIVLAAGFIAAMLAAVPEVWEVYRRK